MTRLLTICVFLAAANVAVAADALDCLLPRPRNVVRQEGTGACSPVRVVTAPVAEVPGRLADEAYRLVVARDGVTITAPGPKGVRWARATLEQLRLLSDGVPPCCTIVDVPTYPWRGIMHDCGRNFLEKSEILKLLDLMALYKLNLFHWHITDYYGWRLESKRYPMLQAPWAFRRQIGKFYTQEDFREVVRYAKARGITVMPELDVPGHTLAFRRGLGITYMSEPKVLGIVSDLVDELCSLASAEDMPFVHLGTDEARTPYEMVSDSFCSTLAERVAANGRTPVAWTPGKPIKMRGDTKPVRMLWHAGEEIEQGERAFDTVKGYFGSLDPFRLLNVAAFAKPFAGNLPKESQLGFVACSWHDDYLGEDTSRIWTNVNLALAVVAYSDMQWSGRSEGHPEFLVKMPAPGTSAFAEAVALEESFVAHRDKIATPRGLPFAYVRQTPLRFRISDADGSVVARDVAQATMMIAACGRHALDRENSYLMKTQGVAVVETWIRSPVRQEVGAWIGFTAYGRSGGRSYGLPASGEWGWSKGVKVEVNGAAVPAPAWTHPGLRKVMSHPEEPTSNNIAETAFTNEEYFMRDPTPIVLDSGWNHVKLTVPKTAGDVWKYDWLATFVPVTKGPHPKEVQGLEFSSQPMN